MSAILAKLILQNLFVEIMPHAVEKQPVPLCTMVAKIRARSQTYQVLNAKQEHRQGRETDPD